MQCSSRYRDQSWMTRDQGHGPWTTKGQGAWTKGDKEVPGTKGDYQGQLGMTRYEEPEGTTEDKGGLGLSRDQGGRGPCCRDQ